jgi:hypothetical protein
VPEKHHPKTTRHNYLAKVMPLIESLPEAAGLVDVTIQHDDWCDCLLENGFCNCDPDVYLGKPTLGES